MPNTIRRRVFDATARHRKFTPRTNINAILLREAARAVVEAHCCDRLAVISAVQRVLQTVEPRRLDSWSRQPQLLSLALREARAINAGGQLEPEPVG